MIHHLKQVGQFAEQFSGNGQQDSGRFFRPKLQKLQDVDHVKGLSHVCSRGHFTMGLSLQDSMELIEWLVDGLKEEHFFGGFCGPRKLLERSKCCNCCRNVQT